MFYLRAKICFDNKSYKGLFIEEHVITNLREREEYLKVIALDVSVKFINNIF